MIDVSTHKQFIDSLLKKYSIPIENLMIVESPNEWAKSNGLKNFDHPRNIAFSVKDTDRNMYIILKSHISEDEKSDVIQRIIFKSDKGRKEFLAPDIKFLEHLIIHEIAHLTKGYTQAEEDSADQFAFDEMGFVPNVSGY